MEGEVLLKSWYISVDPYMRSRMNDSKSYVHPYELGQPIIGGVVSKVMESKSDLFTEGDIVVGTLPWATKCTAKADDNVGGEITQGVMANLNFHARVILCGQISV